MTQALQGRRGRDTILGVRPHTPMLRGKLAAAIIHATHTASKRQAEFSATAAKKPLRKVSYLIEGHQHFAP